MLRQQLQHNRHTHLSFVNVTEQGVEVHLVVDAISSQRLTDRQTAMVVGTAMYPIPPHLFLHYVVAL